MTTSTPTPPTTEDLLRIIANMGVALDRISKWEFADPPVKAIPHAQNIATKALRDGIDALLKGVSDG